MQLSLQNRRYMMGVVMCLIFMPPGMWVTSLPNILETYDAGWLLPYATALPPIGMLVSALIFGALSDRKMHAEKLLGILGISGAFFLWFGFPHLSGAGIRGGIWFFKESMRLSLGQFLL